MSGLNLIAFDTETHLIEPGLLAPKLVCVSTAISKVSVLLDRYDGTNMVEDCLRSEDTALVGHNVAYDLGVMCARRASLIPLVFKAMDAGRIFDTKIRQELLDIASGRSQRNGATFAMRGGEWVKAAYSLAGLAGQYLGKDRFAEKADADAWRMRYAELDDVPVESWPVEATKYALEDAKDTLAIFLAQGGLNDVQATEHDQVRAAWALHLMSMWGVRTDPQAVDALEKKLLEEQARLRKRVIQSGLLVPKKLPKSEENDAEFWTEEVKRRKATKKDLQRPMDGSEGPEIEWENGQAYVVTRTQVPCRWAKDQKKLEEYTARYLQRRGQDPELTATGRVSTAKDTLVQSGSRLLELVADGGGVDKVLGTYVPVLRDGTKIPVNARFNVLVNTARTSCVSGDTLVRTSTGYKPMLAMQIGDLVWTHRNRFRPVTRFLVQGVRPTFDVRFSNGKVLRCTGDHRLLTSDLRWVTVEDMKNACVEKLDEQPRQSKEGFGTVPRSDYFDSRDSATPANDASECLGDRANVHASGREEGVGVGSIFHVEAGRQESDEGQDARAASQLAGCCGRRVRVFDNPARWKTTVCASCCHGSGSRSVDAARVDGCASHRQQPEEQRARQLGACDENGASRYPCLAGSGLTVVGVEEINAGPSVAVYDLTVLEDESYETEGVLSHNCSEPNLQNLPSGRKVGGTRECFVPRPGYVFVSVDYDTLELRALAEVCLLLFGKSEMAAAINADRDLHSQVGATMLGMQYEEVEKGKKVKGSPAKTARDAAKVFNFGAPGGLGAGSLVDYARAGYGVTLTETQAREMKAQWLRAWPEMTLYFQWVNDHVGLGEATLVHPVTGFVRGDVGYTDGCNHLFQHLAAQGAKRALYRAAREAYADPSSPFFGSRPVVFVHDEIIAEVPEGKLHEAAHRLAEIMVEAMSTVIRRVKVSASPAAMRRWTKEATDKYKDGKLIPFEDAR